MLEATDLHLRKDLLDVRRESGMAGHAEQIETLKMLGVGGGNRARTRDKARKL
jgi:hypothetical protein